jgi:hypothetical protein
MIRIGAQTFEIRDLEDVKITVADYDEEETAGYAEYPSDVLRIGKEGLLLTDPIYLADVFNDFESSEVAYLWQKGLMIASEGFGPIVRLGKDILFFNGLEELGAKPEVLSEGIGGDSGTVLVLPLAPDIQPALRRLIEQDKDKAVVYPAPGEYRVGIIGGSRGEEEFEDIVLRPVEK